MDDRRFIEIICDHRQRVSNYKDMVVAYYDRVTDAYRELWGDSFHLPVFSNSRTLADAIAQIEDRIALEGGFERDSEVLDVGCGVGGPTLRLARITGARLIGINLVPQQIEIARRRAAQQGFGDRVQFGVADGMCLPFGNAHFDGVTVFESGCHMPDKPGFYRECARVLKPGGRFLGIDWMKSAGLPVADELRYIEPICRLHGIPGLIGIDDFRVQLVQAGLSPEVVEDLASRTGLLQAPAPDPAPDWTTVSSRGSPPAQELLYLGGDALTRATQSGAFVLCHWIALRT